MDLLLKPPGITQKICNLGKEKRCRCTVQCSVVESKTKRAGVAYHDGVVGDGGPRLDGANPQDCHLRLLEDRRERVDPVPAKICNRECAAFQVLLPETPATGLIDELA